MSEKMNYTVAMIGIPDAERNILRNIFKLSLYRAHTYTLVMNGDPGQIMLVDADDSEAIAQWQSRAFVANPEKTRALFKTQEHATPSTPTIMVAREQPANASPHWIRRPFVATRVLGILDQVVAKLPVKPVAAPVMNHPEPDAIIHSTNAAPSPTALVVDDSSTVRKQVELELKQFGIQIDTAESGEQAFELLSRNNYDLIFLDVILPGVDGYYICKTIKKSKTTKQIPVIMLTSKSSPFDRVKGALSGCDTYLTKPVKQSAFHGVVKKYLKSSL